MKNRNLLMKIPVGCANSVPVREFGDLAGGIGFAHALVYPKFERDGTLGALDRSASLAPRSS